MNATAAVGAIAALVLACVWLGWWARGVSRRNRRRAWPGTWNLEPRPLFTAHERSLHRELRAALPQHLVLAKVGLLRFCQASDAAGARDWYERLQPLTVSFLICSPNGTPLSAIDFDLPGTPAMERSLRMKEAVLATCRIRYVRCTPGQWPRPALLSAWVLGPSGDAPPAVLPGVLSEPVAHAGDLLARRLRERRAERAALWAESGFSPDSFFAFDGRTELAANSVPAPLSDAEAGPAARVSRDGQPRPIPQPGAHQARA